MTPTEPSYRRDLALVHHLGFGFHADACAPGIIALLAPVRARDGLVVELGCGSGLLTRYLVDAGLRVIATDASPAMLDLARSVVPDALDVRRVVLPDDEIPECDAIVSIGHTLSYLPDEAALNRALARAADAVLPGGVFAIDLLDVRYGEVRTEQPDMARLDDAWAIYTRYEVPAPDRFVRAITTFVRNDDGSWRRDDERHENVLVDTSRVPALLAEHGIDAEVRASFGTEKLPDGLTAIVGGRPTAR
jgi:SAM-dependent methyltransferase